MSKATPGALLFEIRRSHRFIWKPGPYRHISGGKACHWLWWWFMIHNVEADQKNAEHMWTRWIGDSKRMVTREVYQQRFQVQREAWERDPSSPPLRFVPNSATVQLEQDYP